MDKALTLSILKKSRFSDDFIQYAKAYFSSKYKRKFHSPYVKRYEENPLLKLSPQERMIETIAHLEILQKAYEEKGIPLTYFYRSIYDLSYRIERYYNHHGSYGLSERDIRWLSPIFQMEIFDIGVLRFQISHFSFAEIERSDHEYMPLSDQWKKEIPEGTPIITLHIMKGAAIQKEKVLSSFKEAIDFFDRYFPDHDYELFVCRTWLIYKPIQTLLPEDSNITAFANLFTIIAQNQNTKQALERIYGTSDLEEIEKMEKQSSLQKKVYRHLDQVGEAAGIIKKNSFT